MSAKIRVFKPADIEAMIDRLQALKQSRKEEADRLEAKADEYFKKYDLTDFVTTEAKASKKYMIRWRQTERAKKWKSRASRLRDFERSTEKRLQYFSRKLAELRTQVLPGIVGDNSVGI